MHCERDIQGVNISSELLDNYKKFDKIKLKGEKFNEF